MLRLEAVEDGSCRRPGCAELPASVGQNGLFVAQV